MKCINVAHITTVDDSLYGLLLHQMQYLQQVGYKVIGISNPGQYVLRLEAAGIQHRAVPMTRTISPSADLVAVARLVRLLRQERVTIVHTHTPKAGLLGQLAARIAGTPVVINTIHGFYFHEHMPWQARQFYIAMERLAALCSSRILSQNQEDMHTALRLRLCRPGQIKHLGNGIDLQQFDPCLVAPSALEQQRAALGLAPTTRVVGFVGRLAGKRKGFEDFLAAAQQLAARLPNVRFVIVGEADRGKADALGPEAAQRYGIAEHCHFLGQRPNAELPGLYRLMDVLVLPSLFEGIPRVIMEASSMGVPTVATDVKGNREAVFPGRNGLLVPLHNVPALADAIAQLLVDDALRHTMAQQARQIALEHFDEQRVFRTVQREYAALLGTKGIIAHQRVAPAE